MDRSEFRAALQRAGLGRHVDALVDAARPSIRLDADTGLDHDRLGASRLGGDPDLPAGAEWPRKNGAPLSFVAQVDLAELAPYDLEGVLPTDGLLSLFYDATTQLAWGFDPADRGSWDVRHIGAGQELRRTPAPDDLGPEGRLRPVGWRPRGELAFATFDSLVVDRLGLTRDETIAYSDLLETEDETIHRVLGHPDPVQSGEMQLECQLAANGVWCGSPEGYEDPRVPGLAPGAADWRLLLQVDSQEETDMMWGDLGRLYVWIRDEDLAARRFDRTWLVLQCG